MTAERPVTTPLHLSDPYLKSAPARVLQVTEEGGIVVDRSIFHPRGGGQPGDSGRLIWEGGRCEIGSAARDATRRRIVLLPAGPGAVPAPGAAVEMQLDWARRHRFMRMHTALHLLAVVIRAPVTGGGIGTAESHLDFQMSGIPEDADFVQARLNQLIAADHPVTAVWRKGPGEGPETDAPAGAAPPQETAPLRLVRIGAGAAILDLQPCEGTHVRRTAEIGEVRVGRFADAPQGARRVPITLAE